MVKQKLIHEIKIKEPKDTQQLTAIERFIWWKKMCFGSLKIATSVLIIPLFAFYKGNINLGIRISTLFYLFLLMFIWALRWKTEKADNLFMNRLPQHKPFFLHVISLAFIGLQIWTFYIIYIIWRTVNG